MDALAIRDEDYNGIILTDKARERVIFFIEQYFDQHKRYDINVISKEMNVHYNTAKKYVQEYCERVRQGLLEKEDDIALIQRRLYDVLYEVRNDPLKYGFDGKNERDKVRFELELVDRILAYKKLEDVKAASLVMNSMGTRIADYLNERLGRKIIEQNADPIAK
jgi:hypothetical protein